MDITFGLDIGQKRDPTAVFVAERQAREGDIDQRVLRLS